MKKIEDQSWYKNQILRDEIKKNKKNLNIYNNNNNNNNNN
jgi:hypothetical protein